MTPRCGPKKVLWVENVTGTEELLDAAAYEAFCAQEG